MRKKTYILKNKDNFNIRFDIRKSDNYSSEVPLFIFFHGFKGYKDWGFIPYLAEQISVTSAISLVPDFSRNGIVKTDPPMFDSDIFAGQTITQYLNDAEDLIKDITDKPKTYNIDKFWNGEIILGGHSLGGAIAAMTAYKFSGIKKLFLIAAISKIHRNTERQKEVWKKRGYTTIKIASTGQELKLNYSYIKDKENYSKNQIAEDLGKFEGDTLVIHPEEDLIVKPAESEQLNKYAKNSELRLIKKANHTFFANHIMSKPSDSLKEVFNELNNFVNK